MVRSQHLNRLQKRYAQRARQLPAPETSHTAEGVAPWAQ